MVFIGFNAVQLILFFIKIGFIMSTNTSSEYIMNKKLGAISMLISATGMGLVGTFSRLTTSDLTDEYKSVIGSFLAFGRMTLAFVFFLVLLFITKKYGLFRKTKLSWSIVLGGVCIGLSLGCYVSSTLMTSIANAVFLIYTGPLFCAILSIVIRKDRASALSYLFFLCVFVGMLLTIGIINFDNGSLSFGLDLGNNPEFPQKPLGDLLGLLSGVFYGLAMFFYGYRKDVDSVVRGVWNFFWAAVATLCMSIVLRPWGGVATFKANHWFWAIGLFVFCGVIALGFLIVAGRNLPAIEYTTISYWETVVGVFLGYVVWHEALTVTTAIGGLLVIIGGLSPVFLEFFKKDKSAKVAAE